MGTRLIAGVRGDIHRESRARRGRPHCLHDLRHVAEVRNLQRDPRITVLVETGHDYGELRGLMIEGRAQLVIGRPEEAARIGAIVGARYRGGGEARTAAPPRMPAKRCVVRIIPERGRMQAVHRMVLGSRERPLT